MKPEPQPAGATETFGNERGSASKNAVVELPAIESISHGTTIRDVPLERLQTWFAAMVSHPTDLETAITTSGLIDGASELERVLTRGPRLTALQRLSTYRHGYHARLVECLADDYPAVQYSVGADAFSALAHDYIQRYPSHSPNLNFFGRHFEDHVRAREPRSFLGDLAALEWAMVEVLHAPMAAALTPETLSTIPPTDWPRARLPRAAAARLLWSEYPVNAYFQAWRTDGSPAAPSPAPSATLVYRHDLTLWRLDLPLPFARVLDALFGGATLGEAVAPLESEDEAARDLMMWFREWVQGSVFAGIVLDESQ